MHPDNETFFRTTIERNPDYADAHNNLGNAFLQKGQEVNEAIAHYQMALEIKPLNVAVQNNLALGLPLLPLSPCETASWRSN
jgi:tetratricopeptide (TPR) repeat protein